MALRVIGASVYSDGSLSPLRNMAWVLRHCSGVIFGARLTCRANHCSRVRRGERDGRRVRRAATGILLFQTDESGRRLIWGRTRRAKPGQRTSRLNLNLNLRKDCVGEDGPTACPPTIPTNALPGPPSSRARHQTHRRSTPEPHADLSGTRPQLGTRSASLRALAASRGRSSLPPSRIGVTSLYLLKGAPAARRAASAAPAGRAAFGRSRPHGHHPATAGNPERALATPTGAA